MVGNVEQTPFMKQLVGNDKLSRDSALDSLRTYLSSRREISPIEILKLWKGLFYCMWMSDRPLAQQALASSFAQLIFILPLENVIPFLRGFWQTMQREWTNIDVLRMEKFLLLTRRYLAASFEVLKRYEWKEDLVQEMLLLLSEIPCNAVELRVPNGMRYHIIDIYVDELEQLGYLEDGSEAPVEKLLEPLENLTRSPTKTVRLKAKETLEDKRLPKSKKEDASIDTEEWEGFAD
ncbi:Ribosomal RNA-processing protein 1-like protein [Erysiphe neolycopersici]|uniref:Ribosomal RNA-processing protein 1-like protein n=1 Tax=Erysiphe neolycopersici TaxID=212602 RepID=A0A420HTH4_9PEZI|nr:Ribosomal RNA-processing protein 1-like protein [Erysiphe neolycopersici]